MKGIELCADCAYYNMKKHKCTRGGSVDPDMSKGDDVRFYVDCPLPDVEPAQKWIPCSDRMPDKNGKYLVINEGEIEVAPYDKSVADEGYFPFGFEDNYTDELGYRLDDWIELHGITHWMPLPDPPGGDTNA